MDFLCATLINLLFLSFGFVFGTLCYHCAGKNSKYITIEKDKFDIIPKEVNHD